MDEFRFAVSRALRAHALNYPETSEGTSCVNRAFKVRKKNFLFVGEKEDELRIMLKLVASQEQARQHETVSVGNTGWVTVKCAPEAAPPLDLLTAWVDESFRALAPKTVVRGLDA